MRTMQQVVWKGWKTGLVSWLSVFHKDRESLKLKATRTAPTWLFSLTSYCFIEPVQLQSWFRHLAGRLAISRPAALSGNTWRWSHSHQIKLWLGAVDNRRDCGSGWWGGSLNESHQGEEDVSLSSNAIRAPHNYLITIKNGNGLLVYLLLAACFTWFWPRTKKTKKKRKHFLVFF